MDSFFILRLCFFCLVQTILGLQSSGTTFLSCESCHDQAKCLESPIKPERDDTFFSQSVSCVCNNGFVGDGLTCYDVKLCSDSSCCHQGYSWSPGKGCVDIDECSLPEAPCTHGSQVCANTPGSFECLLPPSRAKRSAVQFPCGNVVCPLGQDCINSRCADPCDHYTVLKDSWRATDFRDGIWRCDQLLSFSGWYRLFLGQSSAQIPETCVEERRCGTYVPLWMNQPHPAVSDRIVERSTCGKWRGDCCQRGFTAPPIHVKNCWNYYVYKLRSPTGCPLAYCAVNSTTSTTPATSTIPAIPATRTTPQVQKKYILVVVVVVVSVSMCVVVVYLVCVLLLINRWKTRRPSGGSNTRRDADTRNSLQMPIYGNCPRVTTAELDSTYQSLTPATMEQDSLYSTVTPTHT